MLGVEDRSAIAEQLSLHGHLVDDGDLDHLDRVFSADVVYDLDAFGIGSLEGVPAIRDAALAMGDANPVGHHVTNIVVIDATDDSATVHSKGVGIMADGTCGVSSTRTRPDGRTVNGGSATERCAPDVPHSQHEGPRRPLTGLPRPARGPGRASGPDP